MAAKMFFSIMGCISFAFVFVLFVVGVLSAGHWSLRVPALTPVALVRLLVAAAALITIGLGLFGRRKWAALGFSLVTLYLAFWAFADAVPSVPWSWDGIGYWYGVILLCPSLLTVMCWRTLLWRGR
jgi:hypothetical protein